MQCGVPSGTPNQREDITRTMNTVGIQFVDKILEYSINFLVLMIVLWLHKMLMFVKMDEHMRTFCGIIAIL